MSTMQTLVVRHRRGRVMGSAMHFVAVGDEAVVGAVLDRAHAMAERLEALWSRFRPTSEISRLNASAPGTPVAVSPETRRLVREGVQAWRRTDGLFDPGMLRAIVDAGYDRDFDGLEGLTITTPGLPDLSLGGPSSGGCERIIVDDEAGTVTLPDGIGFDPGGLGKGLAADLIIEAALFWGVDGIMVNLGGDLRCAGTPPADEGWIVGLPDGRNVAVSEGAVTTSTCLRRRWSIDERGEAHHLIDPSTGAPAINAAAAVTVVASLACDAETLATAIAANGALPLDRTMLGDAVVLVTDRAGATQTHGHTEDYLL